MRLAVLDLAGAFMLVKRVEVGRCNEVLEVRRGPRTAKGVSQILTGMGELSFNCGPALLRDVQHAEREDNVPCLGLR